MFHSRSYATLQSTFMSVFLHENHSVISLWSVDW
jgi:hypothetical protein